MQIRHRLRRRSRRRRRRSAPCSFAPTATGPVGNGIPVDSALTAPAPKTSGRDSLRKNAGNSPVYLVLGGRHARRRRREGNRTFGCS